MRDTRQSKGHFMGLFSDSARSDGRVRLFLLLSLLAVTAPGILGCGYIRWFKSSKYRYSENGLKNQLPEARTVAVLPFRGEQEFGDYPRVSSHLASRLNFLVKDLNVLRPEDVSEILSRKKGGDFSYPGTVEEARKLASAIEADAVIAGEVFEFDPYQPPVLGVSLMMVSREKRGTTINLDRWMQSAKPPLQSTAENRERITGGLSITYDANRDDLREKIRAYAKAHVQEDYAFEDEERWLLMDKFVPFVATNLTRRLHATNGPLAEARKARKKKLEDEKKKKDGRGRRTGENPAGVNTLNEQSPNPEYTGFHE